MMRKPALDLISPEQALTLSGSFAERRRRTPVACAYRRFGLVLLQRHQLEKHFKYEIEEFYSGY